MPGTRRNNAAASKTPEPVEPEVQVNLDEHEDLMEEEEEDEYEGVEEEVEEEEVEEEEDEEESEEEEEEDVEKEVEEEEKDEEEEEGEGEGDENTKGVNGDSSKMEVEEEAEEEETEEDEEEEEGEGDENTKGVYGDSSKMEVNEEDDRDADEIKRHNKLLSLPPHGSEVYIGGLPPDTRGRELKSFCELAVGKVAEIRMMKDKDTSKYKDYAFVTFRNKELATNAIKDLNNSVLKGKKIKCSASQEKNRLFIGNVPRNWVLEDIEKTVKKVGPGVVNVNLLKDPQKLNSNRGFAFVDYYNQACARYSGDKMSAPTFKLGNNSPTVSWAEPKAEPMSGEDSQIKSVYVEHLPKDVTQGQLRKIFKHHGEITKVVLPPAKSGQEKRFGFVHFAEHSEAMKAVKSTEKYEINGDILKCSIAKPSPANEKKVESGPSSQKGGPLPNFAPGGHADMGGGGYGLSPGLVPPMMYGGGPTPGGTIVPPMMYGGGPTPGGTIMPMVMLPDGRLGYVLQQPGVQMTPPHQGTGQSGNSSSGGGRKSRGKRNRGSGRSGNSSSGGGRKSRGKRNRGSGPSGNSSSGGGHKGGNKSDNNNQGRRFQPY